MELNRISDFIKEYAPASKECELFIKEFISKYTTGGDSLVDKHPYYNYKNNYELIRRSNKMLLNVDEQRLLTEIKQSSSKSDKLKAFNLKWHRVMLHPDCLMYICTIAKSLDNSTIIEVGSYTGGLTTAVCLGIMNNNNKNKNIKFISIEPNKEIYDECILILKNIYNVILPNKPQCDLTCYVENVLGFSDANNTILMNKLNQIENDIGLLIIDADGNVARDILLYFKKCKIGCIILIDDWMSIYAKEKVISTQDAVEFLLKNNFVELISLIEWGTIILRKIND